MFESGSIVRCVCAFALSASFVGARAAAQESAKDVGATDTGAVGIGATEDSAAAAARIARAPREREPIPWTLQFEPAVWFASIAGEQKFGGGSSVETQHLGSDDPNATFFGELHLRSTDLTFSMSGFYVNAGDTAPSKRAFDAGSLSVARGDVVESDIDMTSLEAIVGWRIGGWPRHADEARSRDVQMRLDLRAGVRYIDMDTHLRAPGTDDRFSADGAFAHPVVGTRLEIEINRQFSIDLGVDAGIWPLGSSTSYSVSALVGFQWRPHPNVGAQFGFRQLFFGLDNDDLDFSGAVGGVMGALVVRF